VIFTNVIKPTHLCNLACTYCYNDDVRDPIMRPETLERTIEQTFSYVADRHQDRFVNFIWHGGEPMVAGRKFFDQIISLQLKYAGETKYSNSIQTNGVLIDDGWVDFFKENQFTVSISIDGPKHLHDRFRVTKKGTGSFDQVFAGIQKVQAANLPLGVCLVLSRANIEHSAEIYDFLATNRLRFNVIPLNRSGSARDNYDDVGLDAEEYANAWIPMFDRWFEAEDKDYIYCTDFIFKTRAIVAGQPADCIGLENCANTNISTDPVGDVFPCATLSGHDDTKYGNLVSNSLKEIMDDSVGLSFRNRTVDEQCKTCKWQHVCHGGCPARSYKFFGNFHQRDYYCPSLFRMYEHIEQKLAEKGIKPGISYKTRVG
jgi:uncharacterized protein